MKAVDWFFRSRATGRITVAQWPNLALWVVIVTAVVRAVADPHGWVGAVVHWLGVAAIVVWALDEVVRGVNPWRRVLGAAVLVNALV